jgi:hypothetical protein
MRWILLLVSVLAFGFAFSAKAPASMGWGLVLGFITLFSSLFGFAAQRVASSARPDVTLLTDKDINVLRASIRKPGPAPSGATTPTNNVQTR